MGGREGGREGGKGGREGRNEITDGWVGEMITDRE